MKFLTVNNFTIYLFPLHIGHGDFFRNVAQTSNDRVTGAGFVSQGWKCYGESESLGVAAGPRDQGLLDIALRSAQP